jgi:DNA-binding response OmpR family regulator
MKILVAEDDLNTRNGLVEILEDEGYEVVAVEDGRRALDAFVREHPDLVCLDVMMPGATGYDVCREIRRFDSDVPVIFLTAKSEEIDKVLGLELGADDYIVKPFGVKEIIARVRAVTRRVKTAAASADPDEVFRMGDIRVVPAELKAYRGKNAIDLGLRDVKILKLLHDNRGRALDRNAIFNECWGMDHMPNSRSLDQHISQLRKRVERDPKDPQIIRTVHNVGYRYEG